MDNKGYINDSGHHTSNSLSSSFSNMHNDLTEQQAIIYLRDAHDYRSINHRIDKIGIYIYRCIFSRPWIYMVSLTLLCLHLLAFFEYPSTFNTISSLITNYTEDEVFNEFGPIPQITLKSVEFIFLLIILTDGILQAILFGKRRTLRNPWLMATFILSFISFIDLFVDFGINDVKYFVRLRRFFRPFFLMQKSQLMKKVLKSLSKTLKDVFSTLSLLFIWIIAFTLIAVSIFNGYEKEPNVTSIKTHSMDPQYATFYEGFFTLLVLLTTANNPDAMVKVYNENRYAFFFFFVFMIIGVFIIMNVLIAIIYNEFRGHVLDSMQTSRFRRRIASRAMFEVLRKAPIKSANSIIQNDTIDTELLRCVLTKSSLPKWCKAAMVENLDSLGADIINWDNLMFVLGPLDEHKENRRIFKLPRYNNPLFSKFQRFILSKAFEIIGLFLCVLNVIVIGIDVTYMSEQNESVARKSLDIFNWIFICLYVIEQILKIWAMSPHTFFLKQSCVFDFIITFIILIMKISAAAIMFKLGPYKKITSTFYVSDISRVTNLIILIRTARIVKLAPSVSPIISTLFDVPYRIKAIIGVLIVLFYEYALLGMIIFGDRITYEFYENQTNCGEYKQLSYGALNFNDFYSSIVVLWCLLIVNNWQVFVFTFSKALDTKWVHLYMISWWVLAVIVVNNCVTAFVIEAYTQQKAFYEEDHARRNRPDSVTDLVDESWRYLRQSTIVNESFTFQMLFMKDLIEPTEEELLTKLKRCQFLCEVYPHIAHSRCE